MSFHWVFYSCQAQVAQVTPFRTCVYQGLLLNRGISDYTCLYPISIWESDLLDCGIWCSSDCVDVSGWGGAAESVVFVSPSPLTSFLWGNPIFWQGGAGGAAVCVWVGQHCKIAVVFFFFLPLAAVYGPTGRKPTGRMTQPALCFYSHSLTALWASVVHSLPPHWLHCGFTPIAAES